MKREDWGRFVSLWHGVNEVYRVTPSDEAVALTFEVLKTHSLEVVSSACSRYLRVSQFPPKPADILNLIEGNIEDRARVAFQRVWDAIARHGTYASVDFRDQRIHYAIQQMGGWTVFATVQTSERVDVERRFVNFYKRTDSVALNGDNAPKYLPGLTEIEARKRGLMDYDEPVVVGDRVRQKLPALTTQEDPGPMICDPGKVKALIAGIMRGSGA